MPPQYPNPTMQNPKNTLVIGASPNPERYSYKAISALIAHKHPVLALGARPATVLGVEIANDLPTAHAPIHTITLYLNPSAQAAFYERIVALKPERIIFNPGTENPALEAICIQNNIEPLQACTLVLLATNQY